MTRRRMYPAQGSRRYWRGVPWYRRVTLKKLLGPIMWSEEIERREVLRWDSRNPFVGVPVPLGPDAY